MTFLVRSMLTGLLFAVIAASAGAATVSGVVTNPAGAFPGAIVASYDTAGSARATATTDASGHYSLTLPAGTYRLLAYDPAGKYATVFYGNADSFDTSAFIQFSEGAPLEVSFTLPLAGMVAGSVSGGGAPLASGVVEVYNLSGTRRGSSTTSVSGQYSVVLPAGDYKVFAYDSKDAFAGVFAGDAHAFAEAGVVHVDPPATTTVSFALELAARISGTVVDAQTRAPLAGKLAYAYTVAGSLVKTTTTGTDGSFHFSLAPGSYRFVAADPSQVYAPVFYAASRSFERSDIVGLVAGEERTDLTLAAERGGIVRGHVNANEKMQIVAYNIDGTLHTSVETNATGDYALVVAPGTYKLAVIDADGQYATQFYPAAQTFASAAELSVSAGQQLTAIDFSPTRAGRFVGTVRDGATEQLLHGVNVVAYDPTGLRVAQTTTAADGTYRLSMTPGQYRLLAFDPGLEYATAYAGGATSYETTMPLAVAAGAEQAAGFKMFRGVRVTGKVVEEHGGSLDGIEVFALDATGNRVAGTSTSSTGSFTLVVQPGMYTLVTRDPYHRFAMRLPGTPVAVGATAPSPVTLIMDTITRRRTVRS